MPFALKGRVEGLEEALRALDAMPKRLRNKHLKRAIGDGGKVLLQAAKARCPRELGILRKSLGRKVKVYRHTGAVVAVVGARKGFRQEATRSKGKWAPAKVQPSGYADPTKYLHLVELGTRRSRAHRFLAEALATNLPGIRARIVAATVAAVQEIASGRGQAA